MIWEPEQMIAWLSLEGWEPFERYGVVNLRRGLAARTSCHPALVLTNERPTEKWKSDFRPAEWSDLSEKRLRHLYGRITAENKRYWIPL